MASRVDGGELHLGSGALVRQHAAEHIPRLFLGILAEADRTYADRTVRQTLRPHGRDRALRSRLKSGRGIAAVRNWRRGSAS